MGKGVNRTSYRNRKGQDLVFLLPVLPYKLPLSKSDLAVGLISDAEIPIVSVDAIIVFYLQSVAHLEVV